MDLIWCIRHGKDKGFKNKLVACVACECRQRLRCRPYQDLPLPDVMAARREARSLGYAVEEDMPLFAWGAEQQG